MFTTIILCVIAFYIGRESGKDIHFLRNYKNEIQERFSKKQRAKVVKKRKDETIEKVKVDSNKVISISKYRKRK